METPNDTSRKNCSPTKMNDFTKSTDNNEISKDMQKVIRSTPLTAILVKNSVLLPTGVARVKPYSDDKPNSLKDPARPSSSSSSATGNPRNKTALAPGHSLMDWIRLGASKVDLTGVGGVPQVVTMTELAKHNQRNDAWIAIRGVVFNVTRYMDFHPGGVEELMKGVGKDATKLFENVHAWVNYQSILQKCIVGRLSNEGLIDTRSIVSNFDEKSARNSSSLTNDKIKFSLSNIHIEWKQTSNSITFIYKITKNQSFPGFQLIRKNPKNFDLQMYALKNIIKHEYDLCESVQWPPVWEKNFNETEISFNFSKKIGTLWKSYGSRTVVSYTKKTERDYRDWEVVSNKLLAEDVHLLVLKSTNYIEIIETGQHMEARMNVMGTEISRYYTPIPSFLCFEDNLSASNPDYLYLIIKRYDSGQLSPSVTALQQGQTLTLSNGLGNFAVQSFDKYPSILILAAGTGITPMLGIIYRALYRRNVLTVTDILSQPDDSWQGQHGIVSETLLKELIGDPRALSCIFICGPILFTNTAHTILLKLGWKTPQIYEFKG